MKRYLMVPVMLLLGAAPAFAQSNAPSPVTPETQAKVQAVRGQFRGQGKPIFQDMRAAREALRTELQKAQPDDGTLVQLEDRLAGDRQKLQSLRAQTQAELKSQLSPKEYAQLMLSRKHFGRRHGGGRDQQQ